MKRIIGSFLFDRDNTEQKKELLYQMGKKRRSSIEEIEKRTTEEQLEGR